MLDTVFIDKTALDFICIGLLLIWITTEKSFTQMDNLCFNSNIYIHTYIYVRIHIYLSALLQGCKKQPIFKMIKIRKFCIVTNVLIQLYLSCRQYFSTEFGARNTLSC